MECGKKLTGVTLYKLYIAVCRFVYHCNTVETNIASITTMYINLFKFNSIYFAK